MSEENTIKSIREEISDEELASLAAAIKTRYGIDFTSYEKKSLKRGIARIISRNDLGTLLGLWAKILKDREFFLGCIDDLLVNLTELFRNPEIWVKLRDDILADKLKNKIRLRFWHAGCSTGEEIYTMAILLKESNLLVKSSAMATDLSTTALGKAQEGKYSKILWNKYQRSYLSFNPKGKLEPYFKFEEHDVVINDNLKKHVTYLRHNLVQDPMPNKYHIIFCRNVMIYFDESLKMKILKMFHACLEDDGFFIIGYYDMLPDASKDLFVLYDATTRMYKKKISL